MKTPQGARFNQLWLVTVKATSASSRRSARTQSKQRSGRIIQNKYSVYSPSCIAPALPLPLILLFSLRSLIYTLGEKVVSVLFPPTSQMMSLRTCRDRLYSAFGQLRQIPSSLSLNEERVRGAFQNSFYFNALACRASSKCWLFVVYLLRSIF